MGVHWKIMGVHEKPIYRGELPKKGGLNSLQIQGRGGAWLKRGECFWGGGDTPMHTM